MSEARRIAVIGSLNMDLVVLTSHLPKPGETIIGSRYLEIPGGKGANQAYAAAQLGADVAMLGRVGSDEHGKKMIANLSAAGCDASGVQVIQGSSGVALIMVEESGGQNSIVVVPGANERYLPSDLDNDQACMQRARFVLLQLEIPIETVEHAARTAKRSGAKVILDPAPAPRLIPASLLRCVDIVTPNETEAAQLTGRTPGALSSDDAVAVARQLQAAGAAVVIVKLGARGCLLAQSDSATFIPAPIVDAVDTTAAGDVFNGALAVACAEGASLEQACRFAIDAAAVSVTRIGAQTSMPTRAEIKHRTA